ncbi:MAG: DNA-deoxyinosine glycosylase [Bacilli bacterium]|jgi:TDG/mug DNA glycosylase family protein|nr:DNA-deoxyinosine glycosylase [Bacilli bacterium]MCX4254575.1 DNA-deoxyinosine glycosylase [Bacilli bacterium]
MKHNIEPYYNIDSEILILGSFPSVKSRNEGFYYAHPQNRFWKVLSSVFEEEVPTSIQLKKDFLKRNKIALFDVCAYCEIKGSSDTSIKNVIPNDINIILNNSHVKRIFTNGKTAYNLYNKLIKDKVFIDATYLPSTSPANATFDFTKLYEAYQVLKEKCQ